MRSMYLGFLLQRRRRRHWMRDLRNVRCGATPDCRLHYDERPSVRRLCGGEVRRWRHDHRVHGLRQRKVLSSRGIVMHYKHVLRGRNVHLIARHCVGGQRLLRLWVWHLLGRRGNVVHSMRGRLLHGLFETGGVL